VTEANFDNEQPTPDEEEAGPTVRIRETFDKRVALLYPNILNGEASNRAKRRTERLAWRNDRRLRLLRVYPNKWSGVLSFLSAIWVAKTMWTDGIDLQ